MALESFCITYHNHTSECNSNLGASLPKKTLPPLLKVVFYCGGCWAPCCHETLVQVGKGSENTVGIKNPLPLELRLMEVNHFDHQKVL